MKKMKLLSLVFLCLIGCSNNDNISTSSEENIKFNETTLESVKEVLHSALNKYSTLKEEDKLISYFNYLLQDGTIIIDSQFVSEENIDGETRTYNLDIDKSILKYNVSWQDYGTFTYFRNNDDTPFKESDIYEIYINHFLLEKYIFERYNEKEKELYIGSSSGADFLKYLTILYEQIPFRSIFNDLIENNISENKTYKYYMNAKNDVYIELKIESSTRNKLEKLYIHQDGEIYKYIEDDDDFSKNIKQHYSYSFIPQNIELSLPDKTQYTIIE